MCINGAELSKTKSDSINHFMIFKYQEHKCDVEIYSNEEGIIVKFFNKEKEPKDNQIVDYVYVESGYGYINLKRKGEEGVLSGFLKKDFFVNSRMVNLAIDFVIQQLPNMGEAYIPYNLERVVVSDAAIWTGESFEDIKED